MGGTQLKVAFDFHNHSNLSPDGDDSPEEMVLQAINLGMKYYAITDHLEINKFYDKEYLYEEPVRRASELMPQLAEKYNDKIKLLYGVELGQPLHDIELTNKMLAQYNYDFILGSCHMIKGYEDFYFLDYTVINPQNLMGRYFEEILEMAEWNRFDSLGHLTYPLRYITGDFGIKIDLQPYAGIIDKIFTTLIKNGKGIEINTSGLHQRIGATLPDISYIKRYRELGGEILTIGSDAHCVANLGRGINVGIAIAKEAGFDKVTYFEKRIPHFINI